MNGSRNTVDKAVACRSKVVALQLNGRKASRTGWKVRDAAVATRGVGEGHDRPGMQIAVGRDEKWFDLELSTHTADTYLGDIDAEVTRQVALTALIEIFGRQHVGDSPAVSRRRIRII